MSIFLKATLTLCAILAASCFRLQAKPQRNSRKEATTDTTVFHADQLLCGHGTKGAAAREKKCAAKCISAMQSVELPPFPLHFFGGHAQKDRDEGASMVSDVDAEQMADKVVVQEQSDFVLPMNMAAYFSCYTRSKWPLFNAWVVSPELQGKEKKTRAGSFGNVPKDRPEYASFHAKYKDEFLRAGDVKGVWSDYFGFDQGHWAPDAPFRMKKELVESTYYYINVSPQSSCLNRQEWEHLESSIREWAVSANVDVSVMAGPLERLPEYFVSTPAMTKKWTSILEQWRVAGEVLMRGVTTASGTKDPHWVEVTEHVGNSSGSHCMLRGNEKANRSDPNVVFGVERDEMSDLARIRSCKAKDLLKKGLGNLAFYLMTQAGKSATRRGVRVPLAYWKVASWTQKRKQVYCCYLMDQAGIVDMRDTGDGCLDAIGSSFDVIPPGLKHAGEETCAELYSPRGGNQPEEQQAQETEDCNFGTNGIGWRGAFLLDENGIDY